MEVLTERPELYREITGTADPREDWPGIGGAALHRAAYLNETRRLHGRAPVDVLSQDDEGKLVNQWHATHFLLHCDVAAVELSVSRSEPA